MITLKIHISGLVQGVGFRPFIYNLARREGIVGIVENRNDGVVIHASADQEIMNRFKSAILEEAPAVSRIDEINAEELPLENYDSFIIKKSESISGEVTGVSPDIASCDKCLEDMLSQKHRINYPLINCTNCGPRFTIIREIPYDRSMTTMAPFEMCDMCRSEYEDVDDRRFHAQPLACNDCGPVYSIIGEREDSGGIIQIVRNIAEAIERGEIVALKGTGGYHLVCDACNQEAVELLRKRKNRDSKPFAVMCRDIETVKDIAYIDAEETKLLKSWMRPVVLLSSKNRLADSVSCNLSTAGIILPYMPVHYMIFKELKISTIVFTSANLSDEPVIICDKIAEGKLAGIADLIVSYNREIYNRADDSVARVMAGHPVVLRRSRSYVPSSIRMQIKTEGIFAAGAELVNTFAIGKGNEVIMSQYIGDLKNEQTFEFYKESYDRFKRLFRFNPGIVASDLHPDYLSSEFASNLANEKSIPHIRVQHHHAHIASCMAEHQLQNRVIGLSLDGVGLGSDGNIWGGEILLADLSGFERVYHFDYVPIVGADRVSLEPWRSGVAYLLKYCSSMDSVNELAKRAGIITSRLNLYIKGLENRINTHDYSSAGRLFDAVAAICGVNTHAGFHAEAPMRLESILDDTEKGYYDYALEKDVISFGPTIEQIVQDVFDGISPSVISARFHNSVANALLEVVGEVSKIYGLKDVVLSGGTFQNAYLSNLLYKHLKRYNYNVYLHSSVPQNDGGIALGQLAVAASITAQK